MRMIFEQGFAMVGLLLLLGCGRSSHGVDGSIDAGAGGTSSTAVQGGSSGGGGSAGNATAASSGGKSECVSSMEPVCGSDGVTYENDCARMVAGVAFDHTGSCWAKPDAAVPPDTASEEDGFVDLCEEVPCLADLIRPCLHTRQCTSVRDPAAANETNTFCYSNGVKHQLVSYEKPSPSALWRSVLTAKRGSEVCFTVESTTWAVGGYTHVFRDGNGQQVAATSPLKSDMEVTCKGGSAVVVSNACWDQTRSGYPCQTGECTF
jgi:hypothetical protein